MMRKCVGDTVKHPERDESGQVVGIITNPACLLRTLVIEWDSGETEEWSEIEFGPLQD
ncbi:hypothetical protein URH17368_0671 [Alicyclobacillus hesperidum URH17-3-68]|uniref:DUF4314 domain-containing protein n=2 Tax=Alicyclobacillus hesperidum TaxID=89784 RepID=A0A1H2VW65_9BACL|nr:hypothetical protein URH17368_0671 [Alicyclobacillus hesperidum URH17-3-68]SDW72605.1 hypothetical protein SAMN04489725_11252 [Alicyclobacillus hesperidum]